MDLSSGQIRRIRAQEIYAYLVRAVTNDISLDPHLRAGSASLGCMGTPGQLEAAERHRIGVDSLRGSVAVQLAYGRVEQHLEGAPRGGFMGGNTAQWANLVMPALERARGATVIDPSKWINNLLDDVVERGIKQFGHRGISDFELLGLAAASVTAYGHGFFLGFHAVRIARERAAEQASTQPAAAESEARGASDGAALAAPAGTEPEAKTKSRTKAAPKRKIKAKPAGASRARPKKPAKGKKSARKSSTSTSAPRRSR